MSVDNVSILSKADGTAVKVAPKTVVNLIGAFFWISCRLYISSSK